MVSHVTRTLKKKTAEPQIMSRWNLPDVRQNPTCGWTQWPDRSNLHDYHSTIIGSIFAHISMLAKTVSSLHSWKHLLMFHTSCKTMYNVLSYTHILVWLIRVYSRYSEVGDTTRGLLQKRQSPDFRSPRGWHLCHPLLHVLVACFVSK